MDVIALDGLADADAMYVDGEGLIYIGENEIGRVTSRFFILLNAAGQSPARAADTTMNLTKKIRGGAGRFTLVEFLIVVAIIGLLAPAALPAYAICFYRIGKIFCKFGILIRVQIADHQWQ